MKSNLNAPIQLERIIPLFVTSVVLAIACFAVLPKTRAVTPAPDGGYPNWNTAEGQDALFSVTTGAYNTALGGQALYHNTTGAFNTATGLNALLSNTTGGLNTATGVQALNSNTSGIWNTATGVNALFANTSGGQNTAIGVQALFHNTTGSYNTANGTSALFSNTTGHDNTAVGIQALFASTGGNDNTAIGFNALRNDTDGLWNTAVGSYALSSSTTGGSNTATGVAALNANTNGGGNTANGYGALRSNVIGGLNTAIGSTALVNSTGNFNTALGAAAGFGITTANNVICIASNGANVSNSCFIGHIRGVTTENSNAVPVVIDSAGQLGTVSSSRRFKTGIQPMDKASEAILALKPVTFHYKSDKTATAQFGLIAEEVASADPNLVVRDENGKIYTVRYDAINAMLLNEFLREHRKVQKQGAEIAKVKASASKQEALLALQQREIKTLTATLKEHAGQIQKVSAQLAVHKTTQRVALNNH